MSPSIPELVLRPALCRLGSPLGVGIPDLSNVLRRAMGVTALLPSLRLSASASREELDIDTDWEWPCPPECPLKELRGRGSRPSTPLMDDVE